MPCHGSTDFESGLDAPNVLVVDDADGNRDAIVEWLSEDGYRCSQAASLAAANERLRTDRPHLVMLDVTMRDGAGFDLLQEITENHSETAVIVLTDRPADRATADTLTGGASSYLFKPIRREKLLMQARSVLVRRQLVLDRLEYTRNLERQVHEQTAAIHRAHEETIHRLVAASSCRDIESGMHLRRMGLLCELLARAAGWSPDAAAEIRLAAPMHDVGKVGIPDAILRKPSGLTREEFEIMKTHAKIGADMLADSTSSMLRMALQIARSHHEHWDGSGYPDGLAEQAIPEAARIVAIVDAYDSLTHDRVYRPPMTESRALDILRDERGTHFDPVLLDLFIERVPEIQAIAERFPDEESEPETAGTSGVLAHLARVVSSRSEEALQTIAP